MGRLLESRLRKVDAVKLTASALERYAACPGSHAAEEGLPYEPSRYAAEGTLLHEVMVSGDTSALTRAQKRLVQICKDAAKELIAEHLPGGICKEWLPEAYAQYRLNGGYLSMKIDFVAWTPPVALVTDWKFGYDLVEAAEMNRQLRAYALAAWQEHKEDIETVIVAIVQPTADPLNRVTVAEYSLEDLRQAHDEMQAILDSVRTAIDMRTPSKHCKYCKALGTTRCPESTAAGLVPIAKRDVMPHGAELGQALNTWQIMKALGPKLEEHAKEEIQAGNEIPGWHLKPGYPIRTLPNIDRAWERASAAGLEAAEFTSACKVSIGPLQDALTEHYGWSAKEAKAKFAEVMGDAIVMDERGPSLVKE